MNITIETEARCPNCGTRYLKETDCGDYRCRDLTPRPHTKGQKYLLKGEELVEGFTGYLRKGTMWSENAANISNYLSTFLSTYEKESEIEGKKHCVCGRPVAFPHSEVVCSDFPFCQEGKKGCCEKCWSSGKPPYKEGNDVPYCVFPDCPCHLEGKPEGECEHVCSGNCRRVGCNCECGEYHCSKDEPCRYPQETCINHPKI